MIKRENYINIQGFMITDLGLKGNELLIYAIIYGFSQDNETKFSGSLQYLADWINSSKQTVINCLTSLIEKDLIVKTEIYRNNIKFCEYQSKNLNTTSQKFLPPIQNFLNNNKNDNKDKKDIYISDFNEFWKEYPKQRAGSKEKAYKSYCKVITDKRATKESLLQAVKNYAQSQEVERGFAKGCAAWLNDDRFNTVYKVEVPTPLFSIDSKNAEEVYQRAERTKQLIEERMKQKWGV